ncbi:MAG TPA: TonB-dependent receptor [Sphingomonadales bacterium]
MSSNRQYSLTLSTSIVALVLAGAAHGQEPAGSAPQRTTHGLEEIVVISQKRGEAENLQTVPISVAAITGAALAERQINNISGLANSIPNVQINRFSNSADSAVFTIRGVGVNDADPYVGTTVSVVVDGVVVGVNTAALLSLFDIERVEILRGPQGTLFGANTTGGVINVVTKQPTGELGGEAQLVYGNYDRINANFALNFPVTDKLSGKVSVLHSSHDGYFRNTADGRRLGEENVTSIRGYLRYAAGSYDATLIGEYVRSRNGSQTSVSFTEPGFVLYRPGYGTTADRPVFERGHNPALPDQNDRDTYSITLTQNMESGIGNIVAITNYREYKNDLYSDDDSIELQLLETRRTTDHYQLSQEIRDSFNLTDNIELLIGGFGFLQRYELLQDGVLDGFLPGLGQPQSQWQKNWHLSAFSQVYVDLSEAFRLQAGIRYTHEETKAHSTTANTLSPVPDGPASFDDPIIPGSFVEARGKKSWDEFGWKIGLDYQVTEASMVYGYYARGFKSGGFVGRIVFAEDIGPFDPETLDTFEIGLKSDLFDRRLRINLAAFYNIYKDMQVVQNITYASGANSATIQNAAKAKTKGIELEITAVPVDGLTIAAAGAYLDAAYSEFDTFVLAPNGIDLIPVSFAGNELMNAPKWSGSASVTYDAPVGPGFATIFTEYTYSDPKYTNFTNFPQERTRAIGLFNATLSWRPESERWSIGVYGRNLANKKYFAQKLFLPGTLALGNLGAPREYGLDFRYNW